MSRKGNCLDNAPTESFFSHLKEELLRQIKIKNFHEAVQVFDDFIHFYNHYRIQLKTKLMPLEFRRHFLYYPQRGFYLFVQLKGCTPLSGVFLFPICLKTICW